MVGRTFTLGERICGTGRDGERMTQRLEPAVPGGHGAEPTLRQTGGTPLVPGGQTRAIGSQFG